MADSNLFNNFDFGTSNNDDRSNRNEPSAESNAGGESSNNIQRHSSGSSTRADSNDHQSSNDNLTKLKTERPDDEEAQHMTVVDTIRTTARNAKENAKSKLHLESISARGPVKRFNPTAVRVHVKWKDDGLQPNVTGQTVNEKAFLWRARDSRKGRNSVAVPTSPVVAPKEPIRVRVAKQSRIIGRTIYKMITTFPYWDMAFWSGWAYSWGSVLFVIDGAWGVEGDINPRLAGEDLIKYGGGVAFFIGALLYQIGATVAYLEAVNDGSFQGSAMRRFLEGNEDASKQMLDEKIHHFFGHFIPHHRHKEEKEFDAAAKKIDPDAGWKAKDKPQRPGSFYPPGKAPAKSRRGALDFGESEEGTSTLYTTWRWYPTWHAFKTHHLRDIGYVATAIQLFGATIYGVLGILDLPGILDHFTTLQEIYGYYLPDIIASVCFLTASILFTIETQEKLFKPEPGVIGWWVGVWAIVGSCGFLLNGIFGAIANDYEWGAFQSILSSMWGSAGYLISSLLQWYEAIDKKTRDELLDDVGDIRELEQEVIR